MYTPEFRRHFVVFVAGDTLMTLRFAMKGWKAAADAFIDEGVKSGAFIVHDRKDIDYRIVTDAREERHKLVARVVFLLNITKAGDFACCYAANLVVVDIPSGVESISFAAFGNCESLTTVSFLTTLTSIGQQASAFCYSLENVDLLQTNLQELCQQAFHVCSKLKSMMIPDSLQTLGRNVFGRCFKLGPSNIDMNISTSRYDPTSEVVAHFRSLQN
ncbi:hypothetical protein TL16_g01134 [Triparma laevis f. inornata]|uniref:Uncharacterized protein n=1 Tax=Triparma laevis f. inornata TaxID=1714386 RepID=A0A9W7DQ35_9STRA|nr:hypothetical protein TL16_g01134 [Triparma laevis f. inornata]